MSIILIFVLLYLLVIYRLSNYVYTPEEAYQYAQQLWALVTENALRLNIFSEYPFTTEGVQQAHQDLTGGKTTGKLLIKITE